MFSESSPSNESSNGYLLTIPSLVGFLSPLESQEPLPKINNTEIHYLYLKPNHESGSKSAADHCGTCSNTTHFP